MLSKKFNLYIINSRTLTILKNFSLAKFDLSLSLVVQINIIFVFNILYKRYTLFFFFKSWSLNSLPISKFLYDSI